MSINVVKTDTLLVEYVDLAMNSLDFNFLYRFLEPVPTVWQLGHRTLLEVLKDTSENQKRAGLSEYFLKRWREMLPPDMQPPLGWENEDYEWLYNVNKTCVYKSNIVRGPEVFGFNGREVV